MQQENEGHNQENGGEPTEHLVRQVTLFKNINENEITNKLQNMQNQLNEVVNKLDDTEDYEKRQSLMTEKNKLIENINEFSPMSMESPGNSNASTKPTIKTDEFNFNGFSW